MTLDVRRTSHLKTNRVDFNVQNTVMNSDRIIHEAENTFAFCMVKKCDCGAKKDEI